MPESFDVVVVGARCAGAPLAIQLARSGLKVCLLDRSRFPSEVPSTHAIQANGVAALERLGLAERVRATGAPPIVQGKFDIDGVVVDFTKGFLDITGAPMFSVRRSTLDTLLIEAAAEAGADIRPATPVTALITQDGRVTGVHTPKRPIMASLVVGADGPHSTVARMVASREYHVTPPGRLFMWGYFEGTNDPPPRLWIAKSGDVGLLAAPTDGELFLVAIVPSLADKAHYLADTSGGLISAIAPFEEVAEVVAPGRLVGPVRTMARWHGYFREATGPGWVLVGDAGHFKDPTPGQGIADALRQSERLAPTIAAGLGHGNLDQRLQAWATWRDDDAWEMYWLATDVGAAGPTSPLVLEMIRHTINQPGGAERFLRMFDHSIPPSELFTPLQALTAAATLALTRQAGPGKAVRELKGVIANETSRRQQRRKPRYQPPATTSEQSNPPAGNPATPSGRTPRREVDGMSTPAHPSPATK